MTLPTTHHTASVPWISMDHILFPSLDFLLSAVSATSLLAGLLRPEFQGYDATVDISCASPLTETLRLLT